VKRKREKQCPNAAYLADVLRRTLPANAPPSTRRRALLRAAAALAASAICAPQIRLARAQPRFASDPFTLGVASGSPRANSVILWTRLAPLDTMQDQIVDLRWEVAVDESFRSIVQHGVANVAPELGHSAHVEVNNLNAATWYWYRFMAGDAVSRTGRTRTSPADGSNNERLRFAFASCQQYEQGYYSAYRHMARENLDLVVFLGDYIYESSWGRAHVRKHDAGEPYTLDAYRDRYALYKNDPDLYRA